MKRFFCMLSIVIIVVFTAACSPVVSNTADEIRYNSWSASLRSGSKVSLTFSGDNAVFEVKSSDKGARVKLSGLCVMDSENLAIIDSDDNDMYKFTYSLSRNKLRLKYNGATLNLTRN